jgi:hypothetical protein
MTALLRSRNLALTLAHSTAPVAALRVAVIALFIRRLNHAVTTHPFPTRRAIRVAATIETVIDAIVASLTYVRLDVSIPAPLRDHAAVPRTTNRCNTAILGTHTVRAAVDPVVAGFPVLQPHLTVAAPRRLTACVAPIKLPVVDSIVAGFSVLRLHNTITAVGIG